MMATILDIAKEAGVSHGTVSNVLNGKGNVSSKKMELVLKAAEKLGYNLNNNAKLLRSGKSQTIIMILPSLGLEEYSIFYENALKEANFRDFQLRLYCTYDNPIKERQIIKEIIKERPSGIITVSALEDANEYYEQIPINKSDIIFINRKIVNAQEFITFDFNQAGIEIATFIDQHTTGKIALFTGEENFANEHDFTISILKSLENRDVTVYQSTLSHEYENAFKLVLESSFDCIIATNVSKAQLLVKAFHYGSKQNLPKIITLGPLKNTYSNEMLYYYQDFGYLGERVVKNIIQTIHLKDKSHSHIYPNYGFLMKPNRYNHFQTEIKILTIDSPATHALKKVITHFEKSTNCIVQLDIKAYNEVFQILEDDEMWKTYDIIRLDIAGYSWYGQKIYRPLQGLEVELDEFINALPYFLKDAYVNINDTAYAVPFDISIQMLFYRKDIFDNDIVKRKYFEKTKSELRTPTTFEKYNELITFFNESDFDQVKELAGASMISGNIETIAAEYLLRYYSLNGDILTTSDIELDREIAIGAMKLLYDNYQNSLVIDSNWWGEEVQAFIDGKSAMVIGFMNHLSVVSQSNIKDSIGIADVPGNAPLLGGGILGITKSTNKVAASIEFLTWLNSPEISEQINLLGGNTASYFLSNNSVVRTMYPWLAKAKKTIMNGKRETVFENGQCIDLKHTEEIIGKHIRKLLAEEQPQFEKCVENINEELLEKQELLTIQV
ncbi:extracellular solute-binding protein [Peribacillus huizhouensis]|nr:extracellular solute-binding protein [Peribacillus huizhouensis]